jgi:hypothetical protein
MDAKTFLGMTQTDENTWTFEVTERIMTPGKFMFGGCGGWIMTIVNLT